MQKNSFSMADPGGETGQGKNVMKKTEQALQRRISLLSRWLDAFDELNYFDRLDLRASRDSITRHLEKLQAYGVSIFLLG